MELCENVFLYGDDNENSSDEEIHIIVRRKRYTVRPRPDLFNEYDNIEFVRRFRLHKRTVQMILNLIEETIRSRTDRNHAVSPLHQLLLTLRFYATGTFQDTIADFGGIHKSTMCRIIKKVTTAIASLRPQYINFPNTNQSLRQTKEKFYNIACFPRVVGAIDGGEEAEVYRNRKGIFTINVQVICDGTLKFLDIVARWPGSTHDATIFNASRVRARFINGEIGNALLLGDSGYACSNFLFTPLLETHNRAEELYNESQIRTRNVIERCIGVWKRRFAALAFGLRLHPLTAQAVIVATAVLHNIARNMGEPDPVIDFEVEAAIEELEVQEVQYNNGINNANERRSLIDIYFAGLVR
ncbi:putative nuclease HARBI1 isoform X2 [Mycetomoellerius zeteki]|uniref:putative nuclease HARBI1 isoform X2 n=2 Tax=Mycetomoellerius zeteki TaxID=64791 RepID=UPI00084E47F1|nr:PREDICTED: putative nuclease HARBI1 isoform X2 [Trachymyrmex zeteki]